VAEPYNDENKTIISRMQQRRGLKQDLPQPLRPGEFGFTVDSQQLYIGADPTQAPAYNKTSIYENTTGAVETANTIMNNQMIYVTFPFKKYAKGEPTGATNVFNWLPTSIRLTGVDTDPVFSQVVTNSNNVKSIMTNDTFRATDLIVKRNSKKQEGNNIATYGTLVAEDYIFNQDNDQATTSHNLTFRTIPQPEEEITVSYYDKEAIIKVLSNRNGGGGGLQDGFYSGTAFPSFYTAYNIPEWDQIDPDLIQLSDTSGSAYIGLEFKHIAPRAMGTTIANPGNLSGLCELILVTEGNPVSDRLPTNELIVQTGPKLEIPVANTDDFSLTSPNNIISLTTSGSNWLTANSWVIESIDESNSSVTIDISDFGYTYFPVTDIIIGSGSQLTITSPLAEGLKFGGGDWNTFGQGTNGHCLKLITGDPTIDDMFFRVTSYPSGSKLIGGDIFAEDTANSVYAEISTFESPANVDAIFNTIKNQTIAYVNWGLGVVDELNVTIQPPLTSNVAQVYSKYSNYNVTQPYANIVITDSSVPGEISNGIKPINQFWNNGAYPSTQNTFFIENDSPITSNVTLNHYPILNDGANITASDFYQDNTLIFDLSGANNLNDVVAIVNSQNDWPLLQIVPGETDQFGNPNMLMLTLNPASTSVYTEFEIVPDECDTAQKLGLSTGTYDESNTYKANLEDYFADLLLQPDCPVINSVSVGKLYSTDPLTASLIGKYELPFDETFQELNFNSREEALAFNTVVNNLYFQRSTSDIRGLVNIKSNLEIELKTGITIGDKTVTYVDMNGAIDAIGKGSNQPTTPNIWQNVLGARLNTSDYDSFAIEYTIRESEQDSGPGQGYQRVGTMYVAGRQDFTSGAGAVVYQDYSSEMVDTGLEYAITSSENDPVPAVHLRWVSDGVNVQLQAASRITTAQLTMRYILRRWNSLG
jgi:hypothetical protein